MLGDDHITLPYKDRFIRVNFKKHQLKKNILIESYYKNSNSAFNLHYILEVQVGFIKDRGTRDQISKICWIMEKAREFQKNIYFCFIDCVKTFVWITANCEKFLKRWSTRSPYLSPEKEYASQEATVRTIHGTTDWLKIGKGV